MIVTGPRQQIRTAARRGFTVQAPWIAVVIVVILVALALPAFRGNRRDAQRRASLRSLVIRVIARQAPLDTMPSGYAGAFPIALAPRGGQRVTRWIADSASWSVSVTNDSITRGEKTCGAYHGAIARPLHAGVTKPDSAFCW